MTVRNESPGDAVRNSQSDVTDGDQDDESVNIGRNDEVQEVRSTADEQAARWPSFSCRTS